MSVLDELEQAVREVAERAGPSVVGIGRGRGRGSGIVLAEGMVATNAHNIRGEETTVVFGGDRSAVGQVAGVDVDADLAVIAVDTGGAPAIAWAEDAGAGVGSAVFALANPGGQLRTTFGLVSAVGRAFRGPRGRRIAGAIEHTAPLPRGSSGGPLVDAEGRLLGLNAVRREGGLILAVPADERLARRADALWKGEPAGRPRLGVAVVTPRVARRLRRAVGLPERDGVLVRGVQDGSAADRAGLQDGDLLVAVDKRPLEGVDALYDALEAAGTDGELKLTVVRGEDEREVTVRFGETAEVA